MLTDNLLPKSNTHKERQSIWWRLHIDFPLLAGILVLFAISLMVLFSAGGQDINLIERQLVRLVIALGIMLLIAQLPPRYFHHAALFMYAASLMLLIWVLIAGDIGKGAQRWIVFMGIRFQPSELMKLALPMMVAWYLCEHPLPPRFKHVIGALLLIFIPTILIANQPDLGTSLLIASSGFFVLFLSGLSWMYIFSFIALVASFIPILWYFLMHDYQRRRVLTLLNPEQDLQGAGYHINQSVIAIGSGGIFGKGWLDGTQSRLDFLPERSTDFIFAVFSEEFGLVGIVFLLCVYLFIIGRGLYISTQAQNTFMRLLSGSIILTFFVYLFVNIGMVSGILPVVGLPLPLISYGGTSMITLMASFGIVMSIHTHRQLLSK